MIVDRRQNQILRANPDFRCNPLRDLAPYRIRNEEQLPGDQRGLRVPIIDHDGAHIEIVVNPAESLGPAPITGHRQRCVRGWSNHDASRPRAEGSLSAQRRCRA